MRLEIVNFRCYRGNHVFDLNDTKTTLISGSSGVGKTSLMMALFFVITGQSPPKVIADGCDSCRVTLQWNANTRITRTKRPNRVVIDLEQSSFEDDVAQTYINQIFGKHFEFTSYVQQHYQRTFVYLSPTEKLDILERLCFDSLQDLDPETLKKQCAVNQRELNHRHIDLKSRLRTIEAWVETPVERPTVPVEPSPAIMTEYRQELQQIQQQLKTVEHQEYLLTRQASIDRQLEQLQVSPWLETQLTEHIQALKQLERLHEEPEVWVTHSRTDCEEMIGDYTRDIACLKEYHTTLDMIQKMTRVQTDIDVLKSEQERIRTIHEGQYECPQCNVPLVLMNDELVTHKDYLYYNQRNESQSHDSRVSTEEKKRQLAHLQAKIDGLLPKVQGLAHYQSRIDELQTLVDPSEDIQSLEKDLDWIRTYLETETKKETQNAIFKRQREEWSHRLVDRSLDRKDAERWIEQMRQRTTLETTWQSYASQLVALPSISASKPELMDQYRTIEGQLNEMEHARHHWEMYLVKQKEYETYCDRLSDILNLRRELEHVEARMNAVAELRQLVLKTESEIIEHKIAEITRLVNVYAEEMFVEPISVQMRMTKKTQTQVEKVQVQLEVFYKNMNCDISLLSGGEQARLNLAFILAFAHVFHSPLLLLDECTSNLDQELTSTVLEHIESVGIGKVILIAHQIVEGNFTQILRLQ